MSNPHYESLHPEYHTWSKRWTRMFVFTASTAGIGLLLSLGIVFPCNDACQRDPFVWGGYYAILAYLGLLALLLLKHHRSLQRFRADWTRKQVRSQAPEANAHRHLGEYLLGISTIGLGVLSIVILEHLSSLVPPSRSWLC